MILRLSLAAALALPLAASAQSNHPVSPPPPPTISGSYDGAMQMSVPETPAEFGDPRFEGTLGQGDAVREGDKYYDAYTFSAGEGEEVTVRMTTGAFDAYLIVRGPNGQEWSNDDFGSTQVSQVTFTAKAGQFTIWASSFSSDSEGDYQVYVTTRKRTVLSTVAGRLDRQDAQQIKGEYFDTLTIRPPSAGSFYIELTPLGFTGYLRATSPSGVKTTAQTQYDSGEIIRIGPFRAERGDWTVDITTMSPEEVGAYDLMVVQLEDQ